MAKVNRFIAPHEMGAALRRARRAIDATQWDLARRAGVSQAAVHRAETGVPVSAEMLRRIVVALATLEAETRVAGR
jgi:predicted transcriptional regulator